MEYSENNINYLKQQVNKISDNWLLFTELIEKLNPLYKKSSILGDFKNKILIEKGSIYELPESRYDLASMFFCAESITDNLQEFKIICGKFINCVKHGGFLVASFMENSNGYEIAGTHFPSVVVNYEILEKIFAKTTMT